MNRRKKISPKARGFTLIEILIAAGLLVIVVGLGTNMFFSLMRASMKTKTLELVKQEGNYALSVMKRMIRNAKDTGNYAADFIEIENPDGGTTTFRFCTDTNGIGLIASESADLCEDARLTSDKVNATGFFSYNPPTNELEPWIIAVDFNLEWAQDSTRPEEITSTNFQTTIVPRNF